MEGAEAAADSSESASDAALARATAIRSPTLPGAQFVCTPTCAHDDGSVDKLSVESINRSGEAFVVPLLDQSRVVSSMRHQCYAEHWSLVLCRCTSQMRCFSVLYAAVSRAKAMQHSDGGVIIERQ